jgi:hypothetical protein
MSPGPAIEPLTPSQLSHAAAGSNIWVWRLGDRGLHGIPVTRFDSARPPSCWSRSQPGCQARRHPQELEEGPPGHAPLAQGAAWHNAFAEPKKSQRPGQEAGGCLSPRNLHREPQVAESGVQVPENLLEAIPERACSGRATVRALSIGISPARSAASPRTGVAGNEIDTARLLPRMLKSCGTCPCTPQFALTRSPIG